MAKKLTDYVVQMDELRAGKRQEIQVPPSDFMNFRLQWNDYRQRKEIVGFAQRNGAVTYRFVESGNL